MVLEEELECYRKILSEEDYGMLLKQVEITKEHFITGGAIAAVGNSCRPWVNEVTVFEDCPFHAGVIDKIREIDPGVIISYTKGWNKKSEDTFSISFV